MDIQINSKQELVAFLASEVIDTSEATEILGCSRQNLHYHVSKEKIVPVKVLKKETLFLKSDVLSLKKQLEK